VCRANTCITNVNQVSQRRWLHRGTFRRILRSQAGASGGPGNDLVVDTEIPTSARALLASDGETPAHEIFDVSNLLEPKLVRPRVPLGFVIRPRISRLFAAGVTKPLTVVSAGPGWGKTSAAAAWVASRSAPSHIAWVSLDEEDSAPGLFWSYVLTALRRTGGVPPENPLTEVFPGPAFDDETMRRIIHGLSLLPSSIALVMDDFQEIRDQIVLHSIDALLRHPLPQLRLVVITRVDPMMSLHRLRVSGDLTEIRAADLAFRPEEAAAFFAEHNVSLGASLGRLLDRTEGWAAGLRLAALALQLDSSASRLEEIAGDDRIVADYLASEVLAAQPAELREFLLHTCIADKLTGDLADALTGGRKGQQLFDQLEHANAFVMGLGSSSRWYRYHPMFRSMLQQQLSIQEPDAIAPLHRRASLWFAVNGDPVEAMRHAAAATDWTLVSRLLATRVAPRALSIDRDALRGILEQLPDADGDNGGGAVALCRAMREFVNGSYAALRAHVARAWESLPDVEPDIEPAARVLLHLLSAAEARFAGDTQSLIAHTAAALDLLRGDAATVPAAPEYVAIALSNHGTGLLWSGAYQDAERSLREASDALDVQRIELTKINTLGHLGVAAAGTGHLRKAQVCGTTAVDLANLRGWNSQIQVSAAYLALALVEFHRNELEEADRLSQLGLVARGTAADRLPFTAIQVTQVRIHMARGRLAQAGEEVRQLRRAAATWQPPELLERWLTIAQAELDLARGDLASAARRLTVHDDQTPTADAERACLGRALLLTGDPDKAEQVVAPLRDFAMDRGAEIEAWLVTSLVADYRREDHRATAAAERAISLARDEGFRRPFTLFDGERLPRLVSQVIRLVPASSDVAHDLFAGLVDGRPPHGGGFTEQLTDRELTVLEHLPTMLSNAEIAAQMYVSVNTVKAHLKTLYRKLDVSSRREAVHRARALNLLA
jgi:LuxR family transcriptional regulator, maltose regulon positive regulatory protein